MQILVTNDDGYQARGIEVLTLLAQRFGEVTVVAPQTVQSAQSHAVSLGKMLRLEPYAPNRYYCSGTPADCVKMAFNTLFEQKKPDLVLSGINHGCNASTGALYSGTLAAAAEASLYGLPAIAFSLDSHQSDANLDAFLTYGYEILKKLIAHPAPPHTYLNVNFPHIPQEDIKGVKVCRMGHGYWIKEMDPRTDPYGKPYYWIIGQFVDGEASPWETASPQEDARGVCGDHVLLKQNYITIVPHKIDNTHYGYLPQLEALF